MTGKKHKLSIIIIFILIIGYIAFGTLYRGWANICATIQQGIRETKSIDVDILENNLKDNLSAKNHLIECSGIAQKILQQHLSKDNQFYQDSNGIMHLRRYDADYCGLIDSTKYLAEQLEKREIPFLVCQTSERAEYGDKYSDFIDGGSLYYVERLKEALVGRDVHYLEYKDLFQKAGLTARDIFFKTDVHYTTEAEFTVLRQIVETLESEAGLSFPNKDSILNLDNYQIIDRPFFGNLAYTQGQLYAKTDSFQYYLPDFDTRMHLDNSAQNVIRYGDFENVCMNGLINQAISNPRIYRVVDYMQYPSPCYKITNELLEDNDILVIGCSMSMRTNAYLTLLCHSVTVLDPRSFGNIDYLSKVLENDFDAVILYPSSNLIDGIGGYDAEIQSVDIQECENGLYNIIVEVLNKGSMNWYYDKQIRISLWVNGVDYGLRAEMKPDSIIKSGETYSFIFNNIESQVMQSDLSLQMLKEGAFYFGERNNVAAMLMPLQDYNAKILSYKYENNNLSVVVQNNSNTSWKIENRIKCCLWINGQDWGIRALPDYSREIFPGEETVFVFYNVDSLLGYGIEVQLLQEGICYFGERLLIEKLNSV